MRGFGGQGVAGRGRGGERQVFPVVGAGEDQLRAPVRQVLHVLIDDGCVTYSENKIVRLKALS